MKQSISDIPKKRGRPSTGGRQKGIMVRLDAQTIDRLDEYRGDDTRPEAIRRLIEKGLEKQ